MATDLQSARFTNLHTYQYAEDIGIEPCHFWPHQFSRLGVHRCTLSSKSSQLESNQLFQFCRLIPLHVALRTLRKIKDSNFCTISDVQFSKLLHYHSANLPKYTKTDSNCHCSGFKSVASTCWATGAFCTP